MLKKLKENFAALAFGAALVSAAGIGYWWYFLNDSGMSAKPPLTEFEKSKSISQTTLFDTEPFEPPCLFWRPWLTLVSPENPKPYLQSIVQLLVDQSGRSSQYQEMIMRDPGLLGALRGGAEEICIAGNFGQDGRYHLDANRANGCNKNPSRFLEHNLAIKVLPLDGGGFENEVKFAVHLGAVSPDSFRSFWIQQVGLMHKGYKGWSKAFPEYYKANRTGFGLVEIQTEDKAFTELKLDWLTQAMMTTQIDWASFLLKLGDLARVDMWAETDMGQSLLASRLETRLSSLTLKVPKENHGLYESSQIVPVVIGHDILVKFRGLEVRLKGLKYRGSLQSIGDQFAFDGRFDGVDKVEIAGAYRGLGMTGGLGKMIHDLVQEVINREIGRLKKGHQGEPAKLRLGLYKNGADGQFEFNLRFDAAINILNIVREEKDQIDSPVMPNKKTIADINKWAQKTMGALISDFETSRCML